MIGAGSWLDKIKILIIGIIIGVLICSGIAAWIKYRPSAPSTATVAAPELAKETPKVLECKNVVVYRDAVAKKLGVKAAPGEHIVASSKIQGDDHPHTVSALYSETTGVTRLLDRRDSLPWLDTTNRFGVGVSGGIGSEHDSVVGKLDGYWQPLKISTVALRVTGDLTTDGKWSTWVRGGIDW